MRYYPSVGSDAGPQTSASNCSRYSSSWSSSLVRIGALRFPVILGGKDKTEGFWVSRTGFADEDGPAIGVGVGFSVLG